MRNRDYPLRFGLLGSAVFMSFVLAENAASCLVREHPSDIGRVGRGARQMLVAQRMQSATASVPLRQRESPMVVEQWFGNRLRIKRLNSDSNYAARAYEAIDYTVDRQGFDPCELAHSRIEHNQPSLARHQRLNQLSMGFAFSETGNGNTDDLFVRKPDRFVDTPQIDANGVRHFSNGKHFDLSKMSLDQAIDSTRSSGQDFTESRRYLRRAY
jgi:hypothetical protein